MSAPAAASSDRLGDLLIKEGLISKDQLDKALQEQRSSGSRLGYCLVKLGLVQETEITKMLARQYRMPAVDLSRFEVDPKTVKMIPADIALKHLVLPLKREGRGVEGLKGPFSCLNAATLRHRLGRSGGRRILLAPRASTRWTASSSAGRSPPRNSCRRSSQTCRRRSRSACRRRCASAV